MFTCSEKKKRILKKKPVVRLARPSVFSLIKYFQMAVEYIIFVSIETSVRFPSANSHRIPTVRVAHCTRITKRVTGVQDVKRFQRF